VIAPRRALVLSLSLLLLLPIAAATAGPKPPRVLSGSYGDGVADFHLQVNSRSRTASAQFNMTCFDPSGLYEATSGPKPVTGRMSGNRRGATVSFGGVFGVPTESGIDRTTYWNLKGTFTGPARFKGILSLEMGGPPSQSFTPRAACYKYKRLDLRLELAAPTG
jgi:hypothetical protein